MLPFVSLGVLCLSIILQGAAALPNGCGGSLKFVEINGQNGLTATYTTSDDQACGNGCAAWIGVLGVPGLMAAIRHYDNDSCECWQIGFIETGNVTPATGASNNATFIDFEDIGTLSPTAPQDWGIFTCPEGSTKAVTPYDLGQPGVGVCSWITVIPTQPPVASLGLEGAGICRDQYNAQYAIEAANGYVTCYNDLAGAKYHFNYSSPNALYDLVDFLVPPATSTPTTSSTKTSSVITSTKSSSKSSVKSSSSTMFRERT
ncbi:hypothetical protein BDZ45DRAFT_755227 [Acephala macrosclerotiorum]|nr:hypothetical protein BDZ45DRAFT_755227 [Acephala macrosclerotiorum]